MPAEIPTLLPRPKHIPESLVRDFDMARSDRVDGDVHRYWKERAQDEGPDLFWTPRYGGHWVATRAAVIEDIQKHPDPFSNAEFVIPRGVIPRLVPLQMARPSMASIGACSCRSSSRARCNRSRRMREASRSS